MLGYEWWEDSMSHQSLLAVIGDVSRSKTFCDYFSCTLFYLLPSLIMDILLIFGIEIERASELALGKSFKEWIQVNFQTLFFWLFLWK